MSSALSDCHPSYFLWEEARKSWDHFISNEIVYAFDPSEVANDTLGSIAKRYIEGNVWIEVHLTLESSGDHYAIILEADMSSSGAVEFREGKLGHAAVNGNSSMLVEVAHFVKQPEERTPRMGSVVRLKAIDSLQCICGHSAGVLPELGLRLTIPDFDDGELGVPMVSPRLIGERPNQLIKCSTKAVEEISNNQGDLVGGVLDFNPQSIESMFLIIFTDEGIRVRFKETLQFVPQSLQVYLRPGDFKIGISQRGRL